MNIDECLPFLVGQYFKSQWSLEVVTLISEDFRGDILRIHVRLTSLQYPVCTVLIHIFFHFFIHSEAGQFF